MDSKPWGVTPSGLEAELVALGIEQDDQVPVLPAHASAQADQPIALSVQWAYGPEVEVLAILGDLLLGDPLEPQARTAPARGLDPRPLGGAVLVDVRAQGGCPEGCEGERVVAVERHGLHE